MLNDNVSPHRSRSSRQLPIDCYRLLLGLGGRVTPRSGKDLGSEVMGEQNQCFKTLRRIEKVENLTHEVGVALGAWVKKNSKKSKSPAFCVGISHSELRAFSA